MYQVWKVYSVKVLIKQEGKKETHLLKQTLYGKHLIKTNEINERKLYEEIYWINHIANFQNGVLYRCDIFGKAYSPSCSMPMRDSHSVQVYKRNEDKSIYRHGNE